MVKQAAVATHKYVMVSSEIRRDLEQPLTYFERLEIHHLYNRAPWKDMRGEDFGPRTVRFITPVDLYWQLTRIKPDIIQGPEPFSLLMFPYLLVIYTYLLGHPHTKLVTLSLECIPLAKKYHPVLVPMFRSVLRHWFRRASVIFWFERGSYTNLVTYGAPGNSLVKQLYGSWGVDLENFRPADERAEHGEDKPVILYVGRLAKAKGVGYLIDAFKRLRDGGTDAQLAIVGDGPEREALETQAAASGYGADIIFHGLVKNADLPPYMRSADVFALPSLTSKLWVQQLSMTAWQAMACGLPVVVTDTGQLRDFTPPEAGLLVPERDAEALCGALLTLLTDPTLRAQMRSGAVAYARERFDARANVRWAEETILARCAPEAHSTSTHKEVQGAIAD